MLYESTRGSILKRNSQEAIIAGIADDKGLYVPERIPQFKDGELKSLVGKSYKEVAKNVIGKFFDDFTEEELDTCINGAYDSKFTAKDTVELSHVTDKHVGGVDFLELYHGKTAAFKDMALSILPYLMTTSVKKVGEKNKICILTATSGDTGKAALEGFSDVPGTEIIVFYPDGGVSQVQRQQMVTQEGKNTHVYAIKGNFDDAQTGVKQIFADKAFARKLLDKGVKLSSANSINIGRLVPQVAYYVYSYLKMVERNEVEFGKEINIAVPTGNFGNILAAYFAREMGVPVHKLICASNDNKVLTDFLNTGWYDIRPDVRSFTLTNSPSMDILISSNLERLLYLLNGRNGDLVFDWMSSLDLLKFYTTDDSPSLQEGLKSFFGGFATEKETLSVIKSMWDENGYLMDTHTAVCYKVYKDYVETTGDKTPTVICSTASAYKFSEAVASALGIDIKEFLEDEHKDDCKASTISEAAKILVALNEKTTVEIPYGLKDLDKREVRHPGVIEIEKMNDTVLECL